VIFCIAGLVPGAQEPALEELGINTFDARELIKAWAETGA
jgi:hypothetical protein